LDMKFSEPFRGEVRKKRWVYTRSYCAWGVRKRHPCALDPKEPSRSRRAVSRLKLDAVYASVRRVRWKEEAVLLLPVAYAGVMFSYYVLFGKLLEFLPAVIFLAAIPVMALLGLRGVARYWVPFIMLILSYGSLAGTVGAYSASERIYSIASLDMSIWGFNLTGWVQATFLSVPLTDAMTVFYELQMPLVIFSAALIWYKRRNAFGQFVTAVVLTSYAALATFVIMPTAPPWFMGSARDLVLGAGQEGSSGLAGALNNLIVSDKYAAFPSLHAAFAVLFSYFMFKVDRRFGVLALPVTAVVLFSTIYLGQHYMIDILGGFAYALVPCMLAERYQFFSVK
jgi:membrane-associated phospholipid phosphatase